MPPGEAIRGPSRLSTTLDPEPKAQNLSTTARYLMIATSKVCAKASPLEALDVLVPHILRLQCPAALAELRRLEQF